MTVVSLPRSLNLGDIPAALRLSEEAGWNQTSDDWRLLIERDADACFALEVDGELAATTTLVCYGTRLGWIGMVLTGERFRRRGCARVLFERAMLLANQRGLQTVKLDASEMGAPLYKKFRFIEEQPVERWLRRGARSAPAATDSAFDQFPVVLDEQAFGVDRFALVDSLHDRGVCLCSKRGYVLTRPGREANYLGPVVANDPIEAETLIQHALTNDGSWYWDLLPANAAAVRLARRFGFSPVRRLTRMRFGDPLPTNDQSIFALAGFELG